MPDREVLYLRGIPGHKIVGKVKFWDSRRCPNQSTSAKQDMLLWLLTFLALMLSIGTLRAERKPPFFFLSENEDRRLCACLNSNPNLWTSQSCYLNHSITNVKRELFWNKGIRVHRCTGRVNLLSCSSLSPADASLYCRESGEKEKESARVRRALSIFRWLLFYWDTQREPLRRR